MQAQKRLKVFQTFLLKLIQNPTKLKFFSKIICYQESYLFMYFNYYITLCITFVLFRNSWNLLRGKLLWEMNERGSYSQNF